MEAIFPAISDPIRLQALEQLGLMDAKARPELDHLTELAARCMAVPVCMVSLVGGDKLAFPGAVGLTEPWETERTASLSHSLCQFVVLGECTLAIADTAEHELSKDNAVVRKFGASSYLGVPLVTSDGVILGAFCLIDPDFHDWTAGEILMAEDFAAIATAQLENRIRQARAEETFHCVIHDLKTPLAGMSMATGLLQEQQSGLPEQVQPLLEILSESTSKALQLVKSLSGNPGSPK